LVAVAHEAHDVDFITLLTEGCTFFFENENKENIDKRPKIKMSFFMIDKFGCE